LVIFDSGYSHHIIGDRLNFETLDEAFSSHVELSDNKRVEIKGCGDVKIHSNEGNKKHIHDVFYSPNIGQNLLSVEQMIGRGYKLFFFYIKNYVRFIIRRKIRE